MASNSQRDSHVESDLDKQEELSSEILNKNTPVAANKRSRSAPRTPSGNFLPMQVKTISEYFNKKSKESEKDNAALSANLNEEDSAENTTENTIGDLHLQEVLIAHTDQRKRKLSTSPSVTTTEIKADQAVKLNHKGVQSASNPHQITSKRYKMKHLEEDETDLQDMASELGLEGSLEVLDVRTVLTMFYNLKKHFDSKGISHEMKENIKSEMEQDINKAMQDYEKRITALECQLRTANRKAKLSDDILQYNAIVLDDLTKRMDSLELSNARKMAILSGFEADGKKDKRAAELLDFFHHELEAYTRIEDSYQIGVSIPKPIIITFQTLEDKEAVFANKSKLKDCTLSNRIYLNHYLPANENEKRKRERQIRKDNKALPEKEKVDIEYARGGLKVGSEIYRKKVEANRTQQIYSDTQLLN